MGILLVLVVVLRMHSTSIVVQNSGVAATLFRMKKRRGVNTLSFTPTQTPHPVSLAKTKLNVLAKVYCVLYWD